MALCPTWAQAQGTQETERHQLFANDADNDAHLGWSISASGSLLIVGAPWDDDQAVTSGSVYVFDGVDGAQLNKLVPFDGANGDHFGLGLALKGTIAVIGSPNDDDLGTQSGSAYVIDVLSGQLIHKLLPNNGTSFLGFGTSVAFDGETILVGTPFANTARGAVYQFNPVTGQQIRRIVASDGQSSDDFGTEVSVSGNRILIGAPGDSDGGPSSGSAYLYDTTTGAELAKWTASDANFNDRFGSTVSLHGTVAAIGAPTAPFDGKGVVYLFDLNTGLETHRLEPIGGSQFVEQFGHSLSVFNDRLVVGAIQGDFGGTGSGTAYLFDTAMGTQLSQYGPSDAQIGQDFGSAVAISGPLVAVGAKDHQPPTFFQGAAYTYRIDDLATGVTYCDGIACPCGNNSPGTGCTNGTGQGALLESFGSASVSADDLVLSTTGVPVNNFGLVFMGTAQVQQSFGNGLRCVGGSTFRYLPVQISGASGSLRLGPGIVNHSCTSLSAGGCISAPSTWNFQAWYRDPSGPCGSSFNLSNAMAVTFAP